MTKKRRDFMSDVVLPFSDVKKSDFNSVGNKALDLLLLQGHMRSLLSTIISRKKYLIFSNLQSLIIKKV